MQLLQRALVDQSDPCVYLYGASGTGRTHLLHACCQVVYSPETPVMYLSLRDKAPLSLQVFDGLEQMRLVALDDIDCVMENEQWAEALFHLYNRVRDAGSQLVVSATALPTIENCALPDLASRLTWGFVYHVSGLSDDEKKQLLQERCYDKGLVLPDEVVSYLFNRLPRDLTQLLKVVDQLDQASWATQRRLTIPFVKRVLD